MARDFASPAYQRIAAEWAEKIDKGEVADGFQLPTRPQLEAQHRVSRQVVRDALTLLQTEGYVRSEPSKGTFVLRPPRLDLSMLAFESGAQEVDAWLSAVRDIGREPGQDIRIETVYAGGGTVPHGLDLEPGELIAVRRRRRTVDGIPYAIADSFYPHDLVKNTDIVKPGDITRGARNVLRDLGKALHHHTDRIESRRPHTTEVTQLGIAPGLPVIAHTRVSYTEDDEPVRILASVLPSDRWSLTYEVGP